MKTSDAHFLHSTRREKILESLFIGEVLKELWCRKIFEAELLQSDIDAAGYDVVLDTPCGIRHIQLKSVISGKSWRLAANGKISDKVSGCIVVMMINSLNLAIEEFYWLGRPIGLKPPNIRLGVPAKHSKANSDGIKLKRADSFKIPKSECVNIKTFSEIVDLLIEVKND